MRTSVCIITQVGRNMAKLQRIDVFLNCVRLMKFMSAPHWSTQPCIPPGSLNRVPASAGVKAGKSPLPGGR